MNGIKYMNPEEMKDSGVEWLGEVPEKWEVSAIKYLVKYKKGKIPRIITSETEALIPYVTSEYLRTGITDNYVFSMKGLVEVEDGDLLLLWDGANAGEFFSGRKGALGSTFAKLEMVTDDHYNYIKYYAKTYERYLKTMTNGMGIPHVNSEVLKSLILAKPKNKYDQQRIANFLDIKTAQFDSIIAKKELLIRKLEEAKKSLISEVVTGKVKIIDGEMVPRSPEEMKDSGVKWLGMIPKEWEVTRLKYVGDAIIGLTYSPDEIVDQGGTLVLRSSNVQKGKIDYSDCVYVNKKVSEKLITQEGDILICSRNGSRNLIGKNAVINKESKGISFGAFMTVFRSEIWGFLKYVFNSELFDFQSSSFLTATINQLTINNLNNFIVPIPLTQEQDIISNFLNWKCEYTDELLAKIHVQIQKLKQAKQSLISEAVTGKIDLRDWEIIEVGEVQ